MITVIVRRPKWGSSNGNLLFQHGGYLFHFAVISTIRHSNTASKKLAAAEYVGLGTEVKAVSNICSFREVSNVALTSSAKKQRSLFFCVTKITWDELSKQLPIVVFRPFLGLLYLPVISDVGEIVTVFYPPFLCALIICVFSALGMWRNIYIFNFLYFS